MLNAVRSVVAVVVLVGFVSAGDDGPPAGEKPGYWVKTAGEMRGVMQGGDLSAHADLAALRDVKGLCALGPVAGLQGEVTVIDGKPSVATLRDGKPAVAEAWPKACFLVYARVGGWRTVSVPAEVKTLEALGRFVPTAARRAGLNVEQPLPFLVTGSPESVKYHVVWKSDGLPHTKERHQQAKVAFEVRGRAVTMVGFHSDKHHGVFTHHGSDIHVHFRTEDGRDSGHVDTVEFKHPMTLHLPEP